MFRLSLNISRLYISRILSLGIRYNDTDFFHKFCYASII